MFPAALKHRHPKPEEVLHGPDPTCVHGMCKHTIPHTIVLEEHRILITYVPWITASELVSLEGRSHDILVAYCFREAKYLLPCWIAINKVIDVGISCYSFPAHKDLQFDEVVDSVIQHSVCWMQCQL